MADDDLMNTDFLVSVSNAGTQGYNAATSATTETHQRFVCHKGICVTGGEEHMVGSGIKESRCFCKNPVSNISAEKDYSIGMQPSR